MDRPDAAGPGTAASRAERFEDEKRRIVESCFSKKEPDGSFMESYITHIRITEFSSHPSSPPPPQARTADGEKPRVIIVAVRKSGRVRMHKSKENTNGTFSIGKTWNLDDLSHIESYTGPQVNAHNRDWAGETGFLVTLGRPYFWQAQTDKEKKFFIASLVKIYSKYTSGKVPELVGFDPKELDQILGAGGPKPPQASGPPPPRPPPIQSDGGAVRAPIRPPRNVQSGLNPSPGPTPLVSPDAQSPRLQRGPPPPGRPFNGGTSSPAQSLESSTSRDRPRPGWTAQNNQSQDSLATSLATRSEDASSLPPRSRNGIAGPGAPGRFGEPRDAADSPLDSPNLTTPLRQSQTGDNGTPPERRRPPMDPSRPQDRDLVPPPLNSPTTKRDPSLPPPRGSPKKSSSSDLRTEAVKAAATVVVAEPPKSRDTLPPPLIEKPNAIESPDASSNGVHTKNNSSITTTEVAQPEEPKEAASGLATNPMMKNKKSKNEIAGAFWKAATAATAFKPRAGGAGDRLRLAQIKAAEGPDGITGVVPAPPRTPTFEKAPEISLPSTPVAAAPASAPAPASAAIPAVKLTAPNSTQPTSVPEQPTEPPAEKAVAPKEVTVIEPVVEPKHQLKDGPPEAAKAKEEAKPAPRRPVIAGNDTKYLQALGIDGTMLDDRSQEFGKWLDYFGWVPGQKMRSKNVDELRGDIDRELNKAQAGGWLARFREDDERVDAIKRGVDLAMAECEELDNLLTLYSVELSTLSDDIAYIEAQGQGLQVQTANQKLLKKELESLLETCAITSKDLEALRLAPLENTRGLEDVESALVILYKAMLKIDPSLGDVELSSAETQNESDHNNGLDSDYGKMRIVREKKQMYLQESGHFMRRLVEFMARQFDEAYTETSKSLDGALSKKIDASHHEIGRDILWKYSPLMLYSRDADLENWNRMIQIYQDRGHPVYKKEFQNVVAIWRKNARKPTGEEAELLFTSQVEKQQEGVATAARKMTVKRSQTLARALRSPLADGGHRASADKGTVDRKNLAYEVFLGVLDDLLPLVEMEQNFIVDFFHATTLEQADFPEAVSTLDPRDRRGGDLKRHRLMEPDRELARRVTRSMEVVFAFLETELLRLVEWVVSQDPLQGAGVLAILDKKLGEIGQSNMDFLNMILQRLHDGLESKFTKFVDEQIKAIEETKVKINKRKGVIAFIRVFPTFLSAVENMLAAFDPNPSLRRTIDREYDRILKSMFDSLMIIARENPVGGVAAGSSADPEGKEALNFHILLIENMNHFLEETESHELEVLEEWKEQANSEYHEHMGLYLNAVMRRPLGKLLDNLENIEAQIQTGKSPTAIARQPSNSTAVFSKVLGVYDSKEVRKGIEALRKRVEKHFGDADDPTLSRNLVVKVLAECEVFYGSVENRIGQITTDVYGGDVPFEWPRADVKAAFK